MSEVQHRCPRCGEAKPVSEYPAGGKNRFDRCSACKAGEMRAYKAGFRKDRCAVCADKVEGHGICPRCLEAIRVLGDSPEALKRAAKALAYLRE
ncbi:hypothetical protein ACF1A5_11260 [Streptomyces sp. NPDC014864]|uniref:hypothetical protein n=1 Tax=Streptomyces sp. NPDC014864 TaxID=3364924 RepID=UPI003700DEB1